MPLACFWLTKTISPAQIAELTLTADGLEKEREFYFNKLRDIEVGFGGLIPHAWAGSPMCYRRLTALPVSSPFDFTLQVLCQSEGEATPQVQEILKILYATEVRCLRAARLSVSCATLACSRGRCLLSLSCRRGLRCRTMSRTTRSSTKPDRSGPGPADCGLFVAHLRSH